MKNTRRFSLGRTFFAIVAVLSCGFAVWPTPAQAQGTGVQGQNAVYNATSGVVGSGAFIDASMFPASGRDFWRVAKAFVGAINRIGGAPLFRVLGERVGGCA